MTDAERQPVDDAMPRDEPTPSDEPTAVSDPSDADHDGVQSDADAPDEDAEDSDASDAAGADRGIDIEVAVAEDPRTREELLIELLESEARRDEYLDDLRRARAEFENFRRRTMREGSAQRELGKADVLSGVLEVLDDLDRTLEAAAASEDAGLARGIGLVAGNLVQALQSQGLERIDETGVGFDPNQHEAVQQVDAAEPGGEPTVAQILRPGYRVGDRVLRAAMVVVEQ